MIAYFKLWDTLNRRGMKKSDLIGIISSSTLAKMSKNQTIQTDTLDKICTFLKCSTEDVLEYIPDNKGADT